MGNVNEHATGPFKETFHDHTFAGKLERIVIELETKQGLLPARDTAQGATYVLANTVWGMIIVYKAFGPKKVLWRQTSGLIASVFTTLLPFDFNKVVMRPEEFVDFAVSEAETLAKCYGAPVQVIYHGDPVYARKYLQQQPPQQQA